MYKDFKKTESLDTGFVGGSGIIWMFSGIVLGLLAGLGMYYFSNTSSSPLSTVDTVQQKIEAAQMAPPPRFAKPSSHKAEPVNYKRKEHEKIEQRLNKFSYYAVLPTLDVPVSTAKPIETRLEPASRSSESEKAQALPGNEVEDQVVAVDKRGNYLLQVASFKKKRMANLTKGRLAKRGVNAYIQSKKVKGRLWYRVLAGPVDQSSIDNWKQTAEKLGHHPLIISVR